MSVAEPKSVNKQKKLIKVNMWNNTASHSTTYGMSAGTVTAKRKENSSYNSVFTFSY